MSDTPPVPFLRRHFAVLQCCSTLHAHAYTILVALLALSTASSSLGPGGTLGFLVLASTLPRVFGSAQDPQRLLRSPSSLYDTYLVATLSTALAGLALWTGHILGYLAGVGLFAWHTGRCTQALRQSVGVALPPQERPAAAPLFVLGSSLGSVLGLLLGSASHGFAPSYLWVPGLALLSSASGLLFLSRAVPQAPADSPPAPSPLLPPVKRVQSLPLLWRHTPCWRASLGLAWGWGLVVLFAMTVVLWGLESQQWRPFPTGLCVAVLAGGWHLGVPLAQRLSAPKTEWGLVPCGLAGMALSALYLGYTRPTWVLTALSLLVLGMMSGFALTPNTVFLARQRTPDAAQLAYASQLFPALGVVLAVGIVWGGYDGLHLSAVTLLYLGAGLALLGSLWSLMLVPEFVVRFLFWILTHTLYRIRIVGQSNIPEHGPALLICNHMSFVDGFLVSACMQRFIRFMLYRPFYEIPVLHRFFRLIKAIPIAAGERSEVRRALELARQELLGGHVVCIFAEGAISRTGNLLRFKRGFETILRGLDVPVIPVHLDRLWGSPLTFKSGRLLWRWPQLPYPVTVSFAAPLPSTVRAPAVRQAIMQLGSEAVAYRRTPQDLLHLRFLRSARRHWWAFCMADASGQRLRCYQASAAVFRLTRWLREHCQDDERLGLLLPTSVPTALLHVATLCAGKIPVLLPADMPAEALRHAIQHSGLRTVITSQDHAGLFRDMPPCHLLFLETAPVLLPWRHTMTTTLLALLAPYRLLRRWYAHPTQQPMALATIVFTSGTTGWPKGVMLSHHNILSNLESIEQIFELTSQDRMLGTLPLHHAFGNTVMLWLPLITGFGVIYQADPLDAQHLMAHIQQHHTTFLVSTPAGYAHYLQHCPAAAFASLRHAIAGADKLPETLTEAFQVTYGLPLLEGYGCSEMAPVIAVNVPDAGQGSHRQTGWKAGTVGHPLPGVSAKVVDPHTGKVLPYGTEGLLLVQGPNCMLGYWNEPEKTAAVMRDGWLVTGDTGTMDEDGFLCITGRLTYSTSAPIHTGTEDASV